MSKNKTETEQAKEQLLDYVETQVTHSATCGVCGRLETQTHDASLDEADPKKLAQSLLNSGWREIDSEEYGMIMLACPRCVKEQTSGPKGKLVERR